MDKKKGRVDMRTLVVSDIHGCYKQFQDLLDILDYNPHKDKLILLGDYIDRGPSSRYVVGKVKELVAAGAVAIKGNHEQMLADYVLRGQNEMLFRYNGGERTLESYESTYGQLFEDAKWLDELPMWHEDENYIYVHAGLDPEEPLPENNGPETLLWIRDGWLMADYVGKPVIFGHTPMQSVQIWPNRKKFAVDTGCVFGGKLSCLELPSLKVHEVPGR